MNTVAGEVLVACDGSCLANPGGPTGWAWVAQDGSWASGCQPSGTNQVAELWGVLSVLRDFPLDPLCIQVDSVYAMKCSREWRVAWKKRGWRTMSGDPVKNLTLVKAIDAQLSMRADPVRFAKVPGHDRANRWPLNTEADRRAKSAARWARDQQRDALFGSHRGEAGGHDRANSTV